MWLLPQVMCSGRNQKGTGTAFQVAKKNDTCFHMLVVRCPTEIFRGFIDVLNSLRFQVGGPTYFYVSIYSDHLFAGATRFRNDILEGKSPSLAQNFETAMKRIAV